MAMIICLYYLVGRCVIQCDFFLTGGLGCFFVVFVLYSSLWEFYCLNLMCVVSYWLSLGFFAWMMLFFFLSRP